MPKSSTTPECRWRLGQYLVVGGVGGAIGVLACCSAIWVSGYAKARSSRALIAANVPQLAGGAATRSEAFANLADVDRDIVTAYALKKIHEDPPLEMIKVYLELVCSGGTDSDVSELAFLLESKVPNVRASLAAFLGLRGGVAVEGMLARLLSDPDLWVRQTALEGFLLSGVPLLDENEEWLSVPSGLHANPMWQRWSRRICGSVKWDSHNRELVTNSVTE